MCKANVLNLEHVQKNETRGERTGTLRVFYWELTLAGVVGGPALAGHAHHLRALSLIALFTADLTARPHHILVLLSCWCAAAHRAMFHIFNGSTPWCSYDSRKDISVDLFLLA